MVILHKLLQENKYLFVYRTVKGVRLKTTNDVEGQA